MEEELPEFPRAFFCVVGGSRPLVGRRVCEGIGNAWRAEGEQISVKRFSDYISWYL